MAFLPALSGKNGRSIKRYSDKERWFFTKLVREGMPKWKVCEKYGMANSTLYRIIQAAAPHLIGKKGGSIKGRRVRSGGKYKAIGPLVDGINVLCPVCHPPKAITPANSHDLYEAGNQLHQESDGNGVVSDVCFVCGYVKRLTPMH